MALHHHPRPLSSLCRGYLRPHKIRSLTPAAAAASDSRVFFRNFFVPTQRFLPQAAQFIGPPPQAGGGYDRPPIASWSEWGVGSCVRGGEGLIIWSLHWSTPLKVIKKNIYSLQFSPNLFGHGFTANLLWSKDILRFKSFLNNFAMISWGQKSRNGNIGHEGL